MSTNRMWSILSGISSSVGNIIPKPIKSVGEALVTSAPFSLTCSTVLSASVGMFSLLALTGNEFSCEKELKTGYNSAWAQLVILNFCVIAGTITALALKSRASSPEELQLLPTTDNPSSRIRKALTPGLGIQCYLLANSGVNVVFYITTLALKDNALSCNEQRILEGMFNLITTFFPMAAAVIVGVVKMDFLRDSRNRLFYNNALQHQPQLEQLQPQHPVLRG